MLEGMWVDTGCNNWTSQVGNRVDTRDLLSLCIDLTLSTDGSWWRNRHHYDTYPNLISGTNIVRSRALANVAVAYSNRKLDLKQACRNWISEREETLPDSIEGKVHVEIASNIQERGEYVWSAPVCTSLLREERSERGKRLPRSLAARLKFWGCNCIVIVASATVIQVNTAIKFRGTFKVWSKPPLCVCITVFCYVSITEVIALLAYYN